MNKFVWISQGRAAARRRLGPMSTRPSLTHNKKLTTAPQGVSGMMTSSNTNTDIF